MGRMLAQRRSQGYGMESGKSTQTGVATARHASQLLSLQIMLASNRLGTSAWTGGHLAALPLPGES
jgi:hypothetical protein